MTRSDLSFSRTVAAGWRKSYVETAKHSAGRPVRCLLQKDELERRMAWARLVAEG